MTTLCTDCKKPTDADHALCAECERIRDEQLADAGMYVDDNGEAHVIKGAEADYKTCPNCGGAFGFGTSYEPDAAEICPTCGNVLSTLYTRLTRPEDDDDYWPDDDEFDWPEDDDDDSPEDDDELSEETQPVPSSERAEVVEDAITEDEFRAALDTVATWLDDNSNEDHCLAWWWDVPIPYEITARGLDVMKESAQ